MTAIARHTLLVLSVARSARAGVRRISLLVWAALWYVLGWCVGIVVRAGVLAGIACLQGFADATGWERVLAWTGKQNEL